MAESVMTELVRHAGRERVFEIDSAATSREEIGNPPHHGTVHKLREVGVPLIPHRARQIRRDELGQWNFIITMDEENMRGLRRILGADAVTTAQRDGRVAKLLAFAREDAELEPPARDAHGRVRDVADPWYTGDFDATYRDVLAGCQGLLAELQV